MAGARGNWNSNFGFIMAAVGSAVGLGNLVRFPREMAGNGGAAFLVVYLILLLLVGLPAILGELSLGKIAQMSPVNAFRKLGEGAGKSWAVVGVAGVISAMLVLMYYSVMTGWTLRFFFASFWDGWWDDPVGYYSKVQLGTGAILFNLAVAAVTVFIVSRGISGGIEKVTMIIMPALFAVVILIAIYAGYQDLKNGWAGSGWQAVWDPDFSELSPLNISKATGQVFFSLSLGQGAMLTYASYMEKRQSVAKNGTIIGFADTGVAVLAALMVFPILSFTGILAAAEADPAGDLAGAVSGTFGTAFIAMPVAFTEMGAVVGRIVGTVFFLGLFFAALSSAISLLEVPVSVMIDNLGVSRAKAAVLLGLIIYTFGVLASTSETWFTLFDEIAVNVFIIVGVALTTFFAGWVAKGVAKELDSGLKSRIGIYVVWLMRTVTPVAILAVWVVGGLFGTDISGDVLFWADGDCGALEAHECRAEAAGWNRLIHELEHGFTHPFA